LGGDQTIKIIRYINRFIINSSTALLNAPEQNNFHNKYVSKCFNYLNQMSPKDLAESNEQLRQDLSKATKRKTALKFSPSPEILAILKKTTLSRLLSPLIRVSQ
jgi:hypothetical protein